MYEFEKHQRLTEFIQEMANTGKAPQEWTSFIETLNQALRIHDVSGSVLSDEEMREPIENALYSTKRFITTQATDLAEGILEYIKDAGYTIVRNGR